MEFGAHLPLMSFGSERPTLSSLMTYVRAARDLGFDWVTANDHLIFHGPWLDGQAALATILPEADGMTLATTIGLPVLRHPAPFAKALGALDALSGGRVIAGVGPGSHRQDYALTGLPWEERWPRFDEAIQTLRALWNPDAPAFKGRFYSTDGVRLEPAPAQPGGPPIWIGSWGSDAGLRRVARLGDGWLASAYNTTPELFTEARARLDGYLRERGENADEFPNGLATMWFYITEDHAEADRILEPSLVTVINRPESMLRERLPVGSATAFAEKLDAFRDAGVQRVLIWPVADELRQLELFSEQVRPALSTHPG